jgi:hypothetical protein
MMRRFKSAAGGIFIPITLFFVAMVAQRADGGWVERFADLAFRAVVWPLFLTARLFPPPLECLSCGPTRAAIGAAIVVDFVVYAALTHAVLWLHEKWNPVSAEVVELKI